MRLFWAGLICDVGVPAWRGQRGDRDCEVVSLLRQAGAIPVATTNTPQLCLWTESFNRIYGRTNNPHDTRRTCGGSSGAASASSPSALVDSYALSEVPENVLHRARKGHYCL